MPCSDTQLKNNFLKSKKISQDGIKRIEELAKEKRISFINALLKESSVPLEVIGQGIAECYGVPFADLHTNPPSKECIAYLPEDEAKKYRVIVFAEKKNEWSVATDNPEQKGIFEFLKKCGGSKKISLSYALPSDINEILNAYRKQLGGTFLEVIKQQKDAPTILSAIFDDALLYRASDIHLEPQDQEIIVRFRIDGVLHEIGTFEKIQYETILNRIKVQAHLRTDEHFSAQDGSLRHKKDTVQINMRISIIPTLDGEKIVMRILTEYVRGFTLDDLGLSKNHQTLLTKSAEKPFGMILVVGPTGSGKTTTLYGLLKYLNEPEINITTIEDPVEYKIFGVNHIQVNTQTNLTFAQGLRSIVRQDPDVIFLGEIRDQESAEIAVNAALTGHLLLSTFHANDAATAIPRLLDMGIERFLLSSTLEIIIAQTLVRKICDQCKIPLKTSSPDIKKLVGSSPLFQGKGCQTCAQTGYKGRTALYEFIKNTPRLQELILKNPSTKEVWELARTQDSTSMFEDGIEKVKQGITTIDEVFRVATPPTEKYQKT